MDEKDLKELRGIVEYCFPTAKIIKAGVFETALEFSTPYYKRVDGKMASSILNLNFEIFWKDQIVAMSGIGCVATYPEYRGSGQIRQIMTEILQDEYEKKTLLSYLEPFSARFYEKFGYKVAFSDKYYQLRMTEFPVGQLGKVRHQNFDEALALLQLIHEKDKSLGSLRRTKTQWDYYFKLRSQPRVAIAGEDAYLLYSFDKEKFVIEELVSLNEEARQALFYFISSHASSYETVVWRAPGTENFEAEVPEPTHLEIRVHPNMMARIVNLSEFFRINGEPDFALEIVDPILSVNNGIYGPAGSPVKMTIGEFTAKIIAENDAIIREVF